MLNILVRNAEIQWFMVPQSLLSSCDHRKLRLPVMITLPPVAVEKHCDKPLSVRLQKPHVHTSQNFLHVLHVAVAQYSTDDSAIPKGF